MQFIYVKFKEYWLINNYKEVLFEKLIRLTIYLGVVLIPLFLIPLSPYFVEFSKVSLFYALTLSALVLWLFKILINKRINFKLYFLDFPIIILLFVVFFSSLFSIDRYQSFIGLNFNYSFSFINCLLLVIFYFVVSRFIVNKKQIKLILNIFNITVLTILLLNTLQLFWSRFDFFSLNMPIDTLNLFLVIGLIISGILFLLEKKRLKLMNIFLAIVFFSYIFLIDNQNSLLVLIVIIFLLILLLSAKSDFVPNKLVIFLTAFLFITVLILILPISDYTGLISPVELKLPSNFAWEITQNSLVDNLLVGVGPQNFLYSFHLYKPLSFNQTNFWNFSFTQNSNFVFSILSNFGILAAIIVLVILIKLYKNIIVFIKSFRVQSFKQYHFYLISLVLILIVNSFVLWSFLTNFDFIIAYFLILFICLLISLWHKKINNRIIDNKNLINLAGYSVFIIIILSIGFLFRIYLADFYLHQALTGSFTQAESFDQAENQINHVVKLNKLYPDKNLKLLDVLANKKLFLANQGLAEDFILDEKILKNLNLALQSDNNRIRYYQQLQKNTDLLKNFGLDVQQQEKYINQRLLQLDPLNPEYYIDRALLNFNEYLYLKSQSETDLAAYQQKIEQDLLKSIELKTDYVLGYYNLGLFYQELGKNELSLEYIEKAYNYDSSQKMIVLDLKKLYLNQDKVDQATAVLIEYLDILPGDTEVRLELAQIYIDNQQIEQAEIELNKILDKQPDNILAQELLEELP